MWSSGTAATSPSGLRSTASRSRRRTARSRSIASFCAGCDAPRGRGGRQKREAAPGLGCVQKNRCVRQSQESVYAHFMHERQFDATHSGANMTAIATQAQTLETQRLQLIADRNALPARVQTALNGRSEEHTPELQSRLHLVCR